MMAEEDVGRVILTDNAIPVGIFTERHVLKRVANNDLAPKTSSVKDVMTSPLRAVGDKTHIVEALGEIIRGKIRHLLVRAGSGNIDQSEDFIAMLHD
jgi:signal-transduction protein with cAMP-binding, CBS, and nucleotidyltransferase domain